MSVLIFLIGALLGLVLDAAVCVRYLRQELTARIGPTMDLLQLQLHNLQGQRGHRAGQLARGTARPHTTSRPAAKRVDVTPAPPDRYCSLPSAGPSVRGTLAG